MHVCVCVCVRVCVRMCVCVRVRVFVISLSLLEEILRDLRRVNSPRDGGREANLFTERSSVRRDVFRVTTTSGT